MKTAHLGRRLGDWLGIVPEDEIPWSTPADLFDLDQVAPGSVRAEPAYTPAPQAVEAPPPCLSGAARAAGSAGSQPGSVGGAEPGAGEERV